MTAAYTAIPLITPLGPAPALPIAANALDFTETASGGPVAGDQLGDAIPLLGTTLVLVHNTDAGSQTVTFRSAPDSLNRLGDVAAYSVGAGLRSAFLVRQEGWRQADGTLHVEASDATIKYAAFRIPNSGAPWAAASSSQAGRVAIQPITPVGPYPATPVSALALDFALAAANVGSGNCIAMSGPVLLVATNANASAKTFSVSSTTAGDNLNRPGDISGYSMAQNVLSAVYLRPEGFRQATGHLYVNGSSTDVSFAAFALPG